MPIPGGFASAPTLVLVAVSSPSPGVQITVTATDAGATDVSIYRTDTAGRVIVRGASHTTIAGVFVVVDFEAPIGELLTYTAQTFNVSDVPSDESPGDQITLVSSVAWLTDPLTPSTAVAVSMKDPPELTLEIERSLLTPVGSSLPVQIAGERQQGTLGNLTLVALDSATRDAIRTVIRAAPVVLLRVPDPAWDLPAAFLGLGTVTERRVGRIQDPVRYVELADAVMVQRIAPEIAGPLWTWEDVKATGISWSQLAATKTWLQLLRDGPL